MDNKLSEATTIQQTDKNIIHFEEGIPGFEDVKDYLLYQEDNDHTIWTLQSAHSDIPSFIVMDPFYLVENYQPILTKTELDYFGEKDISKLYFLVIASIHSTISDSVVNLKAPIVIHVETKQAKQIIMDNSSYPIHYQPFVNQK